MNIRNLLVSRRDLANNVIGINAGKTTHNGLELQIRSKIINNDFVKMSSYLSYTYADYIFSKFIDDDNDHSGNELTGVPKNHLVWNYSVEMFNFFYSQIRYQFTDRIPINDDNSIYSKPYHLVNLQTGIKKTFYNKLTFDLGFWVNNLFEEKYASMLQINFGPERYYYPGLPRNQIVSLKIKYRL